MDLEYGLKSSWSSFSRCSCGKLHLSIAAIQDNTENGKILLLIEALPTELFPIRFCRLLLGVISRLVLLSQLLLAVARGIFGAPVLAKPATPLPDPLTETG